MYVETHPAATSGRGDNPVGARDHGEIGLVVTEFIARRDPRPRGGRLIAALAACPVECDVAGPLTPETSVVEDRVSQDMFDALFRRLIDRGTADNAEFAFSGLLVTRMLSIDLWKTEMVI